MRSSLYVLQKISGRLSYASTSSETVGVKHVFLQPFMGTIKSSGPAPNVTIKVDCRERSLLNALARQHPSMKVVALQLAEGDVVISSGEFKILLERKSIEDLYNSVRSGRLTDQVGRMFESIAKEGGEIKTMVGIVLEGNVSDGIQPHMQKSFYETYCSALLRDKIAVLRSNSVEDTARLISCLARTARELFRPPSEFASLVHVERNGRKTNGANVPYLKLLMSIHGVSSNRAHAIAQAYPTMDFLVSSLKTKNGIVRLASLVSPSSKRCVGSPVGSTTALKIAEAILGQQHPEVAMFTLVRFLNSKTTSAAQVIKCRDRFKSVPELLLSYLEGEEEMIPPKVCGFLKNLVDDPNTLLLGLKGVHMVSSKSAEALALHFGTLREVHAIVSNSHRDRESLIGFIRSVNCGISQLGAENIVNWLLKDGFIPPPTED